MEALPLELIAVEIMGWCREFAPALRLVCRAWRGLAAQLPPRETQGQGLTFLASQGCTDLLRLVQECQPGAAYDRRQCNQILGAAARAGHEWLCREALAWGADDYRAMVQNAARGGHEWLCLLVHSLKPPGPASNVFADMLPAAAQGGHEGLCRLARTWGSWNISLAIHNAAMGGHGHVCNLIESWMDEGARTLDSEDFMDWSQGECYNSMLLGAAEGGHEALCETTKDWGATNCEGMLQSAACGGHVALCHLARSWGTRRYARMLWGGAKGGHVSVCQLAHKWSRETPDGYNILRPDIVRAMVVAAEGGHTYLLCQLKTWAIAAHQNAETEWRDGEDCRVVGPPAVRPAGVDIERDDSDSEYTFFEANNWLTKPFEAAMGHNRVEAALLLRSWGAMSDLYHEMLQQAASRGHTAIMPHLRAWGARNFEEALVHAAEWGQLSSMRMLNEWMLEKPSFLTVEAYEAGLAEAAANGHIAAMYILKSWGAADFTGALEMMTAVREPVAELLLSWGAVPPSGKGPQFDEDCPPADEEDLRTDD